MGKHLFRVGMIAVMTFVWCSTASASLTRLQSMGANPNGMSVGKSGQYIEGVVAIDDSTNIFALPATLTNYADLAIIDNLGWSEQVGTTGMFGFHYALEEYTVMALYGGQGTSSFGLSQSTTVGGSASALSAGLGVLGTGDNPAEGQVENEPSLVGDLWFGALIAHNAGGVRLGLGLHMFSASNEVVLPEVNSGESSNWQMDIDLGLGFDLLTEDKMDFGLGFRFGSFEYTGQTINQPGQPLAFYTPHNNFGVEFTGRGQFALFEGTEIVPYGQIMYEMESVTDEFPVVQTGQPFGDFTHFGLEIGTNLKLTPTEKIFIYPGAGLRVDTFTVTVPGVGTSGDLMADDDSQFTLPFYGFGLDARVWDWFAIRFGARQYVKSDTDAAKVVEPDPNSEGDLIIVESEQTRRQIDTEINMGFGLFFGENDEWKVDAHLSPAFFVKGPYILSGAPTTVEGGAEQMNASVALEYNW